MSFDVDSIPEVKVTSARALHVDNPSPGTLYLTMLNQLENKDRFAHLLGVNIGSIVPEESGHPIKKVSTSVNAIKTFEDWEDVPGEAGRKRGVGEMTNQFGWETEFGIGKGIYLDVHGTEVLTQDLEACGYVTRMDEDDRGFRKLGVSGPKGRFEINLGFPNKERELAWRRSDLEETIKNHPDLVSMMKETIGKVSLGENENRVSISFENGHPGMAPSTRKFESKEEVLGYLADAQDLTEVVATSLTKLLGQGKDFSPVAMLWKSKKVPEAIWHNEEKIENSGSLESLSVVEINSSLVRVVQGLDLGRDIPDLVGKNGMNTAAQKLLDAVEKHFEGKRFSESEMVALSPRERSLLALGISLKLTSKAEVYGEGRVFSADEAEMAGVTFHVFGESMRSRLEFFMQQDRKFAYRRDNGEAADFFLLHTTFSDQEKSLTRYERIQSENLELAREWIEHELEPKKRGVYTPADVLIINNILLKGIVPERFKDEFRHTEHGYVKGRFGMTEQSMIESNLSELLESAGNYVTGELSKPQKSGEDTVINRLSREWAAFDGIHPMEEGNGRTGMLLLESWYRLIMQNGKRFVSQRKERNQSTDVMGEALKGDSDHEFWYLAQDRFIKEENLEPLRKYIKSHMM